MIRKLKAGSVKWQMGLDPADWKAKWIGREYPQKIEQWPKARWIAHARLKSGEVNFSRKFNLKDPGSSKAFLRVQANGNFIIRINNKRVTSGQSWPGMHEYEVSDYLKNNNELKIKVETESDLPAALYAILKVQDTGQHLISDDTWTSEQEGLTKNVMEVRQINGSPLTVKGSPKSLPRSILVRKEFKISEKKIEKATAYVSGVGSYVLYCNNKRVNDTWLAPGWTNYGKRIQYQVYDFMPFLEQQNTVAAILGNSWWGHEYGSDKAPVYNDPLSFIFQLHVTYKDGTEQVIISDDSWRAAPSPVLANSIFDGETYDARLEQEGWNEPGFDRQWDRVVSLVRNNEMLTTQKDPPITIAEKLQPQNIREISPGVYVFDFGQNFAGLAQLSVNAPKGTEIRMRFAELAWEDGSIFTENLRKAKATDYYICKGGGEEIYTPFFTYHGFRYVEVTGLPEKPSQNTLTGLVIHTEAERTGYFESSNPLFNQVYQNTFWAQKSNMYSVPTDCPQRSERYGWLGDAQVFAPTAIYNMNVDRFFSKWMQDIVDYQDAEGTLCDFNPIGGVRPSSPGWGDAVIIIPWTVYQYYGDKKVLADYYPNMKAWVEYMRRESENYLYEAGRWGDWLPVEPTPVKPLGTAYFYYSTHLLSRIAEVLQKTEDVRQYEQLADSIAMAFNQTYFNQDSGYYLNGTQAAQLIPLQFRIADQNKKTAAYDQLISDIKDNRNHLSTGFLGTPLLLPALSQRGNHQLAYTIANQKDYPGWGFMVEQGATTIWESWDSGKGDFPGLSSRNHFAFGAVVEWYYQYLAGIKPDTEHPGFKKFTIAPQPVDELEWVKGSYESIYGKIISHWKKTGQEFNLKVSIPANTSATIQLTVEGNKFQLQEDGETWIDEKGKIQQEQLTGYSFENNVLQFELGSGTYNFFLE